MSIQQFYKINCAQAALGIGVRFFNFFACRDKGPLDLKYQRIEVAIEGLPELINEAKSDMPEITHEQEKIDPKKELKKFARIYAKEIFSVKLQLRLKI